MANDPHRHRSTLHIALHFFLPGMLGLASLLGSPTDGGLVWRTTFVIGALVGTAESIRFLLAPPGPTGKPERGLRAVDPARYALLLFPAFVPAGMFTLAPLQMGGIVNGLLLLAGLCYVWLAFAERAPIPTRRHRADLREAVRP